MNQEKPKIAITMGDSAGIGPEIIMKALSNPEIYKICAPLVVGDSKILERAEKILKLDLPINRVNDPQEGNYVSGVVDCLDMDLVPEGLPFGEISADAGKAAFLFLERAIDLSLQGKTQAICTAPINKASLNLGGYRYSGHTEILARFAGVEDYAMMLSSPKLKVIHVTTHLGLIEAIERIDTARVYRVIQLAHETLQKMGIQKPKIAVSGINPHAGEGGLFGNKEEEKNIIPAVAQGVQAGIKVFGPIPPDTVFYQAVQGEYDIVVAMYHDQGHIPIKVLGFESGVNITVGLPFVRTSVDHGTAFDIAGQGLASESSLVEALVQAVSMLGYDVGNFFKWGNKK